MQKLSNEMIDFSLIDRNIIRLDNYINNYTKINWQCVICDNIWLAKSNSIIDNNSGYPKCSGSLKLTNDLVDKKIEQRPIIRLDDYINSVSKIRWLCLNCKFIWPSKPNNIFNGRGCPKCSLAKNEKLTLSFFKKYNIIHVHHKNINDFNKGNPNYIVDFYFPEHSIILEYNGEQHYEPTRFGGIAQERANNKFIQQQFRDQFIRNYCINNNIRLIEIDGRQYANTKLIKYLEDCILPLFK